MLLGTLIVVFGPSTELAWTTGLISPVGATLMTYLAGREMMPGGLGAPLPEVWQRRPSWAWRG